MAAVLLACPPLAAQPGRASVFHAEDITQRRLGQTLSLEDPDGKTRTLQEFRGKVVLLYFGFTHCADVCPTELARLADLKRRLGPAGNAVQVLFVTLDPQRDTPAILRDYAPAFDPSFIALSGNPQAIAAAAHEFRVAYQKIPGSAPDRYTIDHSTYVYALDRASRLRLRFAPEQSIEQLQDDVRALLAER